ncbi:MAG: hypothetical protein JXA00_06465 [Candidatus Thermoplasmatota archaeon]|nr:hypothetical protein [Candidatus Thermoplasmatota archaeon]
MNTDHWYVRGIRFTMRYFSWLAPRSSQTEKKLKRYFNDQYVDTLRFTGLDVNPQHIFVFSSACALFVFCGLCVLDMCIIVWYGFDVQNLDVLTLVLMMVSTVGLPVCTMNLLAMYPKSYAKYTVIHSLGDTPEILSYLVMYLKLVPNLENSVKFAASESSTTLARGLRKMLWDMEIRVYQGIDDAVTSFAIRWGQWSEYFKRALHLIRSSIQERDEASRVITLNRALDVTLEGTREMMTQFATRLHQPIMVMYSLGIMIPLSLVAMLPAAGLIGLNITIFQVFFLYDLLLPLIVFLYLRRILLSRPATFHPPSIPPTHPEVRYVKKRQKAVLCVVSGLVTSLPGVLYVGLPLTSLDPSSLPPPLAYLLDPHGLNALMPITLFFLWGLTMAVTLYCLWVYHPYKKIRDQVKQIEREFGDALYILGKRLAEEKSPEESFVYTAHMMEGTRIAGVFNQTGYNLAAMHTTIRDALFSEEYGSLRHVYSERVHALLRLFVEGIQKSQRAVSISLIKIADHLKELQAVETTIRETLSTLTSTLRSTAALFAPLIAGVTLAITKLISTIVSSLHGTVPADELTDQQTMLSSVASTFTLENIRPEVFVLVIGIYVMELVMLLTRLTNGIDEGDDTPAFLYSLGRVLPVAMGVFTVTIIVGQFLFSQILHSVV